MHLIYVPVGGTSKYQPLDVGVNGSVKSLGKQFSKLDYLLFGDLQTSIDTTIKSLL